MTKKKYLKKLRANSCYPVLRTIINISFYLAIIVATSVFAMGLLSGRSAIPEKLLTSFTALYIILGAFISKEVCSMFVDIADSTIDSNSKSFPSHNKSTAE